ncbi:MAG: HEAT repeat domain-containing protein [Synechocystis sp.]|jgi:HEAT repeat protein
MALAKNSLALCIQALGDRLYDSNPLIRSKAAQSLAELADEAVIPILCKALDNEPNPDVVCQIMDAIVLIRAC